MGRFLMIAALLATPALAQVPGSGVIGAGGGTVGGVAGQVGVNGVGSLNAAGAVNSVNGSVRAIDDAARKSARDAYDRLSRAQPKAKAGVRVDRGARCYAEADAAHAMPYAPVYREDAYYCEPTGPGIAVDAKAKSGG